MKDGLFKLAGAIERGMIRAGVLPPSVYRLPDFLGLGGPQCGSTWLHHCLSLHPEVWVPTTTKEVHYFDQRLHNKPLFWYQRFFRDAGDRTAGEITPGYSVLRKDRIRYIRKLMPDLRMVYVIRNPINRVWSSTRRRGVPEDRLVEHIRTQPKKYTTQYGAPKYGTPKEKSEYLKNIRRWTSVFPEDRLLVMLFDDLKNNPRGFLRRVFRHIGVDPSIPLDGFPIEKKINENPRKPMPEECREVLVEMYEDDIRELADEVDPRAAAWID